jgi:hypothetical protein
MRCLNEWVARRANREDDCSGRLWEGRFRSQALLDNGALLACMSYVDLNPVRAKMATSLEGSEFTSIQRRLQAAEAAREKGRPKRGQKDARKVPPTTPVGLAPMGGERPRAAEAAREQLPVSLDDYVALVDWTGRAVRYSPEEQRELGVLTGPPPKLLADTSLAAEAWLDNIGTLGVRFATVIGAPARVAEVAAARGQQWCKGIHRAGRMYDAV